jgi:hypothetical protein
MEILVDNFWRTDLPLAFGKYRNAWYSMTSRFLLIQWSLMPSSFFLAILPESFRYEFTATTLSLSTKVVFYPRLAVLEYILVPNDSCHRSFWNLRAERSCAVLHVYAFNLTFTNIYGRLTWDGYFYGSIISTVAFQTGESLVVIVVFIVYLATSYKLLFPPQIYILPIPASIGLIALNVRALYRGPKHIWMLGVKEAAANNIPNIRVKPRLSLFGTRRTPEDEVRNVLATTLIPRVVWTALKVTITRRTVYVVT